MHCILRVGPRAPAHTRSLAIALQLYYKHRCIWVYQKQAGTLCVGRQLPLQLRRAIRQAVALAGKHVARTTLRSGLLGPQTAYAWRQ